MIKNDRKFFEEMRKISTWVVWIFTEAIDVNCKIRKKSGVTNRYLE